MNAIQLEVFRHRCNAIAEEMGAALERSAFSANIQERRDYSCALFDQHGEMLAQAAHIPVHLGAMPRSVEAAIRECGPLDPGDVILLNDPFCGGTHLPDFTSVAPVYVDTQLVAYSATRAHHADVGGMTPGSMPLSQSIYQEGIIIPPIRLIARGHQNHAVFDLIVRNSRTSEERAGDLAAQLACHVIAQQRIAELVQGMSVAAFLLASEELIAYGERRMRQVISAIPDGIYRAHDVLDSDGITTDPLHIHVALTVSESELQVDFTGTSPQCRGPLNAPAAVTESAVLYALRLLEGDDLPSTAGLYRPIKWIVPYRSLLNPAPPAAVAGGNVETSQRVVDVILRALANALPQTIPAQSAGTMNNWTMGGTRLDGSPFAYYETLGGGMGARPTAHGLDAVQTHMTNTRNTPVEALERLYPVLVESLSIRTNSGGQGHMRGGDGIRKELRMLQPVTLTVLTERRINAPNGSAGGGDGRCGVNTLIIDDKEVQMPGKGSIDLPAGALFRIETPGGGGYGHD